MARSTKAKTIDPQGQPNQPKDLMDLDRITKIINKKEIARRIDIPYQTFNQRRRNRTPFRDNRKDKARRKKYTILLEEMFYVIGVAIGRVRRDKDRKFKMIDVLDAEEKENVKDWYDKFLDENDK